MSTRENLLQEIMTYCGTHGMAPTTFGVLATGDRNLVGELRSGREPRANTIDRIRAFLARPTKPQRRVKGESQAAA